MELFFEKHRKHIEANGMVSTKQKQIAELAKKYPDRGLTSLNPYLDEAWLKAAFEQVRKKAAVGVDGVDVKAYGEGLESRLADLLNRAKSGSYQAPPVRRVYIPKAGKDERRPIGIPTTEDKVLQRAVVMLLEPIYEEEFYDFSYGFRPRRSAHQALEALWNSILDTQTGWMIDLDLHQFFDTIDHGKLREILRKRVRDGVILRLIDKWLKAGVLESGQFTSTDQGTPQGGVISPLLANIFLHEILDQWFAETVKPRLHGRGFLIRYADDCVLGFEREEDARRVMEVLPKRLARFGLTLHPEKTRIIPFKRPRRNDPRKDKPSSQSFDFLGFTHFWGRSYKGAWIVRKKTQKSRFNRALRAIDRWMREHRHIPLLAQVVALNQKLRGHFSYYGVTGNARSLHRFREEVRHHWHKWLSRRCRRRTMFRWERFVEIEHRYPLAPARIVHSTYRARIHSLKNRMR